MPDPFQCTLDRSQQCTLDRSQRGEAVTTASSARGLLMIGLSFLTGLLTAYVLCTTGRVRVTVEPFATIAAMSPWASTKPSSPATKVAETQHRTAAKAR